MSEQNDKHEGAENGEFKNGDGPLHGIELGVLADDATDTKKEQQ